MMASVEEKKTRKQFREAEKEQQHDERLKPSKVRVRLIPIWLRLMIIIVLFAVSLMAGAIVGYGIIGDGKPTDVFKKDTWQHIIDLVEKGK